MQSKKTVIHKQKFDKLIVKEILKQEKDMVLKNLQQDVQESRKNARSLIEVKLEEEYITKLEKMYTIKKSFRQNNDEQEFTK